MRQSSIDTAVRIRERKSAIRSLKRLIKICKQIHGFLQEPVEMDELNDLIRLRQEYRALVLEITDIRIRHLQTFGQYERKNMFQLLWSVVQIYRLEKLSQKQYREDERVGNRLRRHVHYHRDLGEASLEKIHVD